MVNGEGHGEQLKGVGIVALLERDPRPTFVVDLKSSNASFEPAYINPSLCASRELGQALFAAQSLDRGVTPSHLPIWAISAGPEDGNIHELRYDWTAITLQDRWRVVSGIRHECEEKERKSLVHVSPAPVRPRQVKQRSSSHGVSQMVDKIAALNTLGDYDVTVPGLIKDASAHVRFFHSFDWASTELGPMSLWSLDLRRIVNQLMTDPRPAAMYWGKNLTMMYNEAYMPIAGKKHPWMMGKTLAEGWSEIYDVFIVNFKGATGEATTSESASFYVERNGYLEEIYATWAVIPVVGEHGYSAYYNPVFETTRQHLADRRMSTLLWLGQCISTAKDTKDYWQQSLKGLERNHYDVPFAALYASAPLDRHDNENNDDASTPSERSSTFGSKQWALEGTLGIAIDYPGLPSHIDSDQAAEVLTPLFRKAIRAGHPTVLSVADGTYPANLVGETRSRAFPDDVCNSLVLLPVGPSTRDNILGFLLIGINPRRAYDQDYAQFIQLLHRHMGTSMASVVLIEEELRRNRIAADLAAQDRIQLSNQLAQAQESAVDSQMRFRNMADLAPVAMFHFDALGNVLYANDNWFKLTQHPRDAFYPLSWYNVIEEDDHALMDREWAKLATGEPVSFELRLKKPFIAPEIVNGERVEGQTWIIAAAYTTKREDGSVKEILGCLTDISRQKWAEGFQERRMREAMEMKRQQENFIDMTSHEMRNPLSAIILCADSISTSFAELKAASADPIQITKDMLDNQAEAAQTIVLCAQHQKRIIDDVLTLSKLDSGLLLITPVEVQPAQAIEQALHMFDGELMKADVSMRYRVDASYHDLHIDWVKFDPSRLLQVLINLLTNAIKFTQTQQTREITVKLSASTERPSSGSQGVQYLSRDVSRRGSPVLGKAEVPAFLSVEVKDTGRGLTEHEMKLLFQRFSQASPKTHVEYGGSGLGLFISRELTELQGGEIGVASEAGVGSTFAFYVKALRCSPPRVPVQTLHHRASSSAMKTLDDRRGSLSEATVASVEAHIASDTLVDQARAVKAATTSGSPSGQHLLIVEDVSYARSLAM